ncbi:site-specific DNA-methyltransferase [Methylorubrum aminovorans]
MSVRILTGDCRDVLATLPDESVHCVVTSPPYFGLRDYGVAGQIGLEDTPAAFVAEMAAVFREVRRVLRNDGTLWLNLGDTYNNRRRLRSSSHQPSLNGYSEGSWAEASAAGLVRMSYLRDGLKEKDAIGVPWTVAMALRTDGWFLRQEIIWRKTFGKPEPTKDRLPSRHEPIFMLSKSKAYHFDRSALPAWAASSVWDVAPTGHDEHGAAFAAAVVEPCVLAGCPIGGTVLDPFGGAGTTGLVSDRLGRDAILIELNPAYATIARDRLARDGGMFANLAAE